jgi:MraZ protein
LAGQAGSFAVEVKAVNFSGQDFSLQGEKGRFVLPAEFRKAVREASGGERILCLAKHDRWNCLTGFGLSREVALDAQIDREERIAVERGTDFDRELRASQLFGFSKLPFDDSGRFVLPERFVKLANVCDRLFFQGAGGFFTIWNPAELARMGQGWEGAQAACAELEAQALAGKGRK